MLESQHHVLGRTAPLLARLPIGASPETALDSLGLTSINLGRPKHAGTAAGGGLVAEVSADFVGQLLKGYTLA